MGYTFAATASKDNKAMNIEKTQAMLEYRKAIEGTIKVLDGAQRAPIQDQ